MPHHQSVGVIITDGKRFLLQQKDSSHPIESWRHKFCLFGGGVDLNETVEHAMRRELLEEFEPFNIALRIFRSAQLRWTLSLKVIDNPYLLSVFICQLNPNDFDIIIKLVTDKPVVKEGRGIFFTEATVKCLLNQPDDNFVASHDRALAEYFEDNVIQQEEEDSDGQG